MPTKFSGWADFILGAFDQEWNRLGRRRKSYFGESRHSDNGDCMIALTGLIEGDFAIGAPGRS